MLSVDRVGYHWLEVELSRRSRGTLLDSLRHGARCAPAAEVLELDLEPCDRRERPDDRSWLLRVGGGAPRRHPSELAAVEEAYRTVHDRVLRLAEHEGWLRLHAATVDLHGRRILLAGRSGAGKTTLAAALLADGWDVRGDEAVFVRDGIALPLARRLHVRPATFDLLPALRRVPDPVVLPYRPPLWTLDPAALRGPFDLRPAPVSHIVLLDPVHHGPCELSAAPSGDVLGSLAAEALPYSRHTGPAVRQLAAVLREARCHRLRLGDLRDAPRALRTLAGDSVPGISGRFAGAAASALRSFVA